MLSTTEIFALPSIDLRSRFATGINKITSLSKEEHRDKPDNGPAWRGSEQEILLWKILLELGSSPVKSNKSCQQPSMSR